MKKIRVSDPFTYKGEEYRFLKFVCLYDTATACLHVVLANEKKKDLTVDISWVFDNLDKECLPRSMQEYIKERKVCLEEIVRYRVQIRDMEDELSDAESTLKELDREFYDEYIGFYDEYTLL